VCGQRAGTRPAAAYAHVDVVLQVPVVAAGNERRRRLPAPKRVHGVRRQLAALHAMAVKVVHHARIGFADLKGRVPHQAAGKPPAARAHTQRVTVCALLSNSPEGGGAAGARGAARGERGEHAQHAGGVGWGHWRSLTGTPCGHTRGTHANATPAVSAPCTYLCAGMLGPKVCPSAPSMSTCRGARGGAGRQQQCRVRGKKTRGGGGRHQKHASTLHCTGTGKHKHACIKPSPRRVGSGTGGHTHATTPCLEKVDALLWVHLVKALGLHR
jgi:hypothetical protein